MGYWSGIPGKNNSRRALNAKESVWLKNFFVNGVDKSSQVFQA
jgi:hypothetical protein